MNFIEEYHMDNPLIADRLLDLFLWADANYLTSPGVVGNEQLEKPTIKKSTDVFLQRLKDKVDLNRYYYPQYMEHINDVMWKYINKYDITKYCGRLETRYPPQMQWYKPNEGFFQWHADGTEEASQRALVYLTYLNDVPGGGTEFLHHGYVEAERGKTVIFPTSLTHIHRGRIATSDKYIITGWVYWDVS